jgi:hypothetical protein
MTEELLLLTIENIEKLISKQTMTNHTIKIKKLLYHFIGWAGSKNVGRA